uniref:Ig-like domain-containing protein n=1 Tax=Heterorhabditis bacteriophora TaxID=37862 RepID=A0A1I7WGM7_HETBA
MLLIFYSVPPGDPRVVEAPSESIVEGEMVTFKCSSSGGSPNPTFSWSFLNGSIADSKYLNTFTKGGETESTLHFRVRPEDNGAFLTCGVINKAMLDNHTKDVDTPRLNVLFKPRVHVAPVQDLTVEVGQIVQLICTADANPTPPSYEWYVFVFFSSLKQILLILKLVYSKF